jgi:hypothetical protein
MGESGVTNWKNVKRNYWGLFYDTITSFAYPNLGKPRQNFG